jgi:hypothetical protein
MPDLRVYRLFVSHKWSYTDDYNRLTSLLDGASNFVFHNYSVPKADPVDANNSARLTEAIRNQIRPVQCVLIIAGMYVNHSDWIQFEMDFAKELGKPIIGIVPWGGQRTPLAVETAAHEMVAWSTTSIVDAIRRRSL